MQLTKLALFIAAVLATNSQIVSYKNHKVVEVPNTPKVNDILVKINADIWSSDPEVAKVRVSPSQFTELKSQLPKDSKFDILVEDVQKTIDDANESASARSADWFSAYHTYDEIKAWYTQHAQNNQGAVKFIPSIGKTLEGNDIFAVHLTNPNGARKKKVWFQSLIHAREWISGAVNQYVFNELLKNRQTDPTIKSLLDQVEIIFIPVVNPDGYKYTQTERYWRTNRNGENGVDINRNFPFRWGGPGTSPDPIGDSYRGKYAGSELETQAIIKYYAEQGPILGGIDWHSHSELILRPFGDTRDDSAHEAQHKKLGDGMAEKIKQNRGKVYTSQKSSDLYPSSGTAKDWFYGANGSYGYTIELSPGRNGGGGFALPPSEIVPVGKDLLPAAIYFIQYVLENPIN